MDDARVEPLGRSHARDQFDCGQPSLNDFIRALVSQYEKRNLGAEFHGSRCLGGMSGHASRVENTVGIAVGQACLC